MIVLGDVILCFLGSFVFFAVGFLFLTQYEVKKFKFLKDFKESFNQIDNAVIRDKIMKAFGVLSITFGFIILVMPLVTLYLNNIFYYFLYTVMTLSAIIFIIYVKIIMKKSLI